MYYFLIHLMHDMKNTIPECIIKSIRKWKINKIFENKTYKIYWINEA